jgi:hypothetical protein
MMASPNQERTVKDEKDCEQGPYVGQEGSPPRANPCEPSPTKVRQEAKPQENPPCKMSPFARACKEFIHLSMKPISMFTFILTVVGAIQTCAFIKSERASVVPIDVKLAKEVPDYLKNLDVSIIWHNGGKSTANIEQLVAAISHGPLPEQPPYHGAQPFAMSPILPGSKGEALMSFSTEWGKDYTDAFKNGAKPLFLFGRVQYRDELSDVWFFGGIRETGFCYFYRPTGGVREHMFDVCQYPAYTYTR